MPAKRKSYNNNKKVDVINSKKKSIEAIDLQTKFENEVDENELYNVNMNFCPKRLRSRSITLRTPTKPKHKFIPMTEIKVPRQSSRLSRTRISLTKSEELIDSPTKAIEKLNLNETLQTLTFPSRQKKLNYSNSCGSSEKKNLSNNMLKKSNLKKKSENFKYDSENKSSINSKESSDDNYSPKYLKSKRHRFSSSEKNCTKTQEQLRLTRSVQRTTRNGTKLNTPSQESMLHKSVPNRKENLSSKKIEFLEEDHHDFENDKFYQNNEDSVETRNFNLGESRDDIYSTKHSKDKECELVTPRKTHSKDNLKISKHNLKTCKYNLKISSKQEQLHSTHSVQRRTVNFTKQNNSLTDTMRRKSVPCSNKNDYIDKIESFEDDDDSEKDKDYKVDEDSESETSNSYDESRDEDYYSRQKSRKIPIKRSRHSNLTMKTPTKAFAQLNLTPSVHQRTASIAKPSTPLQEARLKLHVSILPKSLPCREEEFNDIYTFLQTRLSDCSGGCIYISGVPGTGKTATVNEVIRCLKKSMDAGKLTKFEYADINGMKLSEPRQVYVQIWKQLTGESKTWEEAQKLLHNRFTNSNSKKGMTLLLADELDLLCTKRQDVVYNLLDWPSKASAKLVVVTIANTMDLPERILMGRVTSRLGLTRLTFPPYNFKQLEQIVVSRLKGYNAFSGESIQLVARKVAAVSGDARRALDICRRSTEIAEMNGREIVTMIDVKQALEEMIASPKIQAIKHCSDLEKVFLEAASAEVIRTGVEEILFKNVYYQLESLCRFNGQYVPNITESLAICARLGSWRLLSCDHSKMDIHQRLLLNVSTDDVQFALQTIDS